MARFAIGTENGRFVVTHGRSRGNRAQVRELLHAGLAIAIGDNNLLSTRRGHGL